MDITPVVILLELIGINVTKPFDDNMKNMVCYINKFIYWNTHTLIWPNLDLRSKLNHRTVLNYHCHSNMKE